MAFWFEVTPNSGSVEETSIAALGVLEETLVDSVQVRGQLRNGCRLRDEGKVIRETVRPKDIVLNTMKFSSMIC